MKRVSAVLVAIATASFVYLIAAAQPVPHAGLRVVTHDATLTGSGTVASPLAVVGGTISGLSTNTVVKATSATTIGDTAFPVTDAAALLTLGNGAADVVDFNGDLFKFGNSADGRTFVNDNTIGFGYGTDADTTGFINFYGYNLGSTRFRSLIISDGKTATIATFTGSTKATTLAGTLDVTGLVTATAGVTTPANLTTTGTGDGVFADDVSVTDAFAVNGNASIGNGTTDAHTTTGAMNFQKDIGTTISTGIHNITLTDTTTAQALGVGGEIGFAASNNSGGNIVNGGFIKLAKTNATDSNSSFDLVLGGRTNGSSPAEVLRILESTGAKVTGTLQATGVTTTTGGLTSTAATNTFGRIDWTTISPTALSADQNNYAPTGFSTTQRIALSTSGGTQRTITGLAGGSDGRTIEIYNRGPDSVLLAYESASSTSTNRFKTGDGNLVYITTGATARLTYDASDARWAVGATSSTVFQSLTTVNLAATGNNTIGVHLNVSGLAPAVTTCGTSPTILGTDTAGTVTIGTGGSATACTLTFNSTYSVNAPSCVLTSRMSARTDLYISAASTSAITVSNGAGAAWPASGVFSYHCTGV